MSPVIAPTVAMLLHPGLLAACLLGGVAEVAAAWALRSPAGGPLATLRALRPAGGWVAGLREPALPASLAGLMVLLAAGQLTAPYNPVAPSQRNVAVAAFALAAAGWLVWAGASHRQRLNPRLMLMVQGCWLLAVLAPAIVAGNLRPQVLGTLAVPAVQPLKVLCALLYLVCLPAQLQLIGAGANDSQGIGQLRLLLWLPTCGLFASLFVAPSTDDPAGLLRFLAFAAVAAGAGTAVAAALVRRHRPGAEQLYVRVVLATGAAVLIATVITALIVR